MFSTVKEYLAAGFYHVKKWAVGWWNGGPHFVVGEKEDPYLLRWYIIPRNPLLCIYAHKFLKDDTDRALHDHPWVSLSFLFKGRYIEELPDGSKTLYKPLSMIFRRAVHRHRIELINKKPAWTLFITGPRIKEWFFFCDKGARPVHWKDFTAPGKPGEVGRGCGEIPQS